MLNRLPAASIILLFTLATGCKAPAPRPDKTPSSPPVINLVELIERDELEHAGDPELSGLGARHVQRTWTAQLIPDTLSEELVIEVFEYTGEGTWMLDYHIYDTSDPGSPRAVERPPSNGGYMDMGWSEAVDLDSDGQAELMMFGDSDGWSPRDIYIYSWTGSEWKDLVYGPDVGAAYVIDDMDSDGTQEIIALRPRVEHYNKIEAIDVIVLAKQHDMYWREAESSKEDIDRWLEGALDPELAVRGRPEELGFIVQALQERGLTAKHLDAARPLLMKRLRDVWANNDYGDEYVDPAPLINAIAYQGSHDTALFFHELLSNTPSDLYHRRALLYAALIELDAPNDRAFIISELESSLQTVNINTQGLLGTLFDISDFPPAHRLLIKKIETAPLTQQHTLLSDLGRLSAEVTTHIFHTTPSQQLRLIALEAIADRSYPWYSDAKTWREVMGIDRTRALLDSASARERALGAKLLGAEPKLSEEDEARLWALFLKESDEGVLLEVLPRLEQVPSPKLAIETIDQLLASNPSGDLLDAAHKFMASEPSPELFAYGFTRAMEPSHLYSYGAALAKQPPTAELVSDIEPALLALLAPGRHERLQQRAVMIAAHVDTAAVRAALRGLVSTSQFDYVRSDARSALGALDDVKSVEEILAFVRSSSEDTDYEAADALAALGVMRSSESEQALLALARAAQGSPTRQRALTALQLRAPSSPSIRAYLETSFNQLVVRDDLDERDCAELLTLALGTKPTALRGRVEQITSTPACAASTSTLHSMLISWVESSGGRAHLPLLQGYAQHPAREVRVAALTAIAAIERRAPR